MNDRAGSDAHDGRISTQDASDESRFRRLADALPALIWVSGPDGAATWFNARWLEFVGRPLDDEVRDGWMASVHPDDAARCGRTYREAFDSRAPFTLEYRKRRADGEYRMVLDQGTPFTTAEGAFGGFVGSCVDVTEQSQAGRAQAFLAAIVASSDDAIIAKDLNGIIQSSNASAERLFGYSTNELIGRPVRILIPHDRQHEEDDILARIGRGDRVDHFETVRVRKDGELLDISLTVSPVRDFTGRIIGVSKVARDITAQKRAAAKIAAHEEALARQREWLATTLKSIGDGVIATDEHGAIVFMNPIAEQLTGWSAEQAHGRPCLDVFRIVNEHTRQTVESPVTRVLTEGLVVGLANHTVLIAADGTERPIDDSGAPIRDRDGRVVGVVLVFRDVTERHRIDAERAASALERERLLDAERIARAEAERASRVKDDFVAMVSHELRTPLNAILGWTQLMLQTNQDRAVIDKGLQVVARNTRLQAQLISDLLDISRIVAGKLQLDVQHVEIAAIVEEAVETLQNEADSKGVTIERSIEPGAGVLAGDPARLQQIVWNLLSNAIKFTPAGGRVAVSLRALPGTVEIKVADTGAGMRAEFLPHVFDRFHQADRSITRRFGGLGLGLAIVKHLVDLHGGVVRAESDGEGKGSTFTITLPSSTVADTGHDGTSAPAVWTLDDAASLEGIRVLVVEDEPDTRDYLVRLLRAQGAIVVAAASAAEALESVRQSPPDLLVSDIGLPEVDGYDLIRRIRQEHEDAAMRVPAIALTAYARIEDRMRALRAGFQGHLAKPVEAVELIAAIASFKGVIEGQRHRKD